MTSRNVAVYGTCGLVLVACLAAANMPSQDAEPAAPRDARPARIAPDAIAVEVRSEAARLHARMADAPTPSSNPRNPFAFGAALRTPRPASREGMVTAAVAPDPAPAIAAAPPLLLMGIAEETSASGPRRTRLSGHADTIYGRGRGFRRRPLQGHEIGADAVELEIRDDEAPRRIVMR
jgi:hypothetical protein